MKQKIGSLYGVDVFTDETLGINEIKITTQSPEMSEKFKLILERMFQPGKWKFVKNIDDIISNEDTIL